MPLRVKSKQNENVKLNDVSYRSWRLGSLYEGSSNGTFQSLFLSVSSISPSCPMLASSSSSFSFNLANNELINFRAGTIDENASPIEGNSWNSNNAQFGCTDTSSTLVSSVNRADFHFNWPRSCCLVDPLARVTLQNLVQKDKQKAERKQKEFPTELTISLQYLPPCDETITGKLVIGIEVLNAFLSSDPPLCLLSRRNGNRVTNL